MECLSIHWTVATLRLPSTATAWAVQLYKPTACFPCKQWWQFIRNTVYNYWTLLIHLHQRDGVESSKKHFLVREQSHTKKKNQITQEMFYLLWTDWNFQVTCDLKNFYEKKNPSIVILMRFLRNNSLNICETQWLYDHLLGCPIIKHSYPSDAAVNAQWFHFPEMSELLLTEEERTAIPEYVAAILNSHVSWAAQGT